MSQPHPALGQDKYTATLAPESGGFIGERVDDTNVSLGQCCQQFHNPTRASDWLLLGLTPKGGRPEQGSSAPGKEFEDEMILGNGFIFGL